MTAFEFIEKYQGRTLIAAKPVQKYIYVSNAGLKEVLNFDAGQELGVLSPGSGNLVFLLRFENPANWKEKNCICVDFVDTSYFTVKPIEETKKDPEPINPEKLTVVKSGNKNAFPLIAGAFLFLLILFRK